MPARSSSFLFSLRLASLLVVGEGVLCGAVSSHARRWGALARPNSGLLLRVPLRGCRASFPVRDLVKLRLPAALVLVGLLGACTRAPSKNETVLTFSGSALGAEGTLVAKQLQH